MTSVTFGQSGNLTISHIRSITEVIEFEWTSFQKYILYTFLPSFSFSDTVIITFISDHICEVNKFRSTVVKIANDASPVNVCQCMIFDL